MTTPVPRIDGRRAFGEDPAGYAAGRPAYPAALFAWLAEALPPLAGERALEIGPGTGQATAWLLSTRPAAVDAVEPDPRLAAWLRTRFADPALRVIDAAFGDAVLAPGYRLAIAATAFHWLDAPSALARLRQLLMPGGTWAMWWNVYRPAAPDAPFERRLDALFAALRPSHERGMAARPPHGLDRDARRGELRAAGFEALAEATFTRTEWLDRAAMVALFATFSPIRMLPMDRRAVFLDALGEAVDAAGGRVPRRIDTPVYLARTPG